jgi:hypothetical protein
MNLVRYCPGCMKATGKLIYYAAPQNECAVCHCAQLEALPIAEQEDDVLMAEQVICDPAASSWLKKALGAALTRDPVDAANDAEVLARILDRRCRKALPGY